MTTHPTLIFGTAGFGRETDETIEQYYQLLEKHNVKFLDTAHIYAQSEIKIGQTGGAKRFTVHTKAPGFRPGASSKTNVASAVDQSLRDLGVDTLDIYYLHAPDAQTPIKETLAGIQDAYKAGKIKQFGLSNYTADQVQEIYDIQSASGAILPTVFQGNYNPVSRHIETDLFPLLRKLNIAFNAYSPIAGGFLVKTAEQLRAGGEGRWDKNSFLGAVYHSLYSRESLLSALSDWDDIAKEAGISKAALAYRWITYHSVLKKEHGDGIIVGATKVVQLEESLKAIEDGPLDEKTVKRVDGVWKKVQHEAPRDNYNH